MNIGDRVKRMSGNCRNMVVGDEDIIIGLHFRDSLLTGCKPSLSGIDLAMYGTFHCPTVFKVIEKNSKIENYLIY